MRRFCNKVQVIFQKTCFSKTFFKYSVPGSRDAGFAERALLGGRGKEFSGISAICRRERG